ncbi:MAG: BglG family transcription antiterminator [Cetobacterium sp.]
MKRRYVEIFKCIIKSNGKVSYDSLSEYLLINERTIRYDIDNINEILKEKNYPLIEKIQKSQIFYYNLEMLSKIITEFINSIDIIEYKEELLLFKVLFLKRINSKDIEEEMGISKTSVKNVLKITKNKLELSNLKLNIEIHKGLILTGSEEDIREAQLKFILTYSKDKYIMKKIENYYSSFDKRKIEQFLNLVIDNTNKILSDEPYTNLYYYILIMLDRLKNNNKLLLVSNEIFFQNLKEYKIIRQSSNILEKEYNIKIDLKETIKLTDYFLGSHYFYSDNSSYEYWIEIDVVAVQIIKKFSETVGVNLSKDKVLLNGIINHLKPTIYRLKNKQVLENSILKDFLKYYNSIFIITKKSIEPLKNIVNLEVTNDEIAFLGVYFKAALDRVNKLENRKNNILLVCGSGYGTSKLLAQQISECFSVNIIEIIPFYKLKDYCLNNIDLIVGTVDMSKIELQKPTITINTLLIEEDLNLLENIGLNKRKHKLFLSDLLTVFKKNGSIKNEDTLIRDLTLLMNEILVNDIFKDELKLSDILEEIMLDIDSLNWVKE